MTGPTTTAGWMRLLRDVPALTLRNPWADYITHHGKDVENRGWMPYDGVTWFFVHAGAGHDTVPADLVPAGAGRPATSAIVALSRIDSVCTCLTARRCSRWAAFGQFHWRLADTIALPEPVPCGGRLKFWRPTPVTVTEIAAQLALTTGLITQFEEVAE